MGAALAVLPAAGCSVGLQLKIDSKESPTKPLEGEKKVGWDRELSWEYDPPAKHYSHTTFPGIITLSDAVISGPDYSGIPDQELLVTFDWQAFVNPKGTRRFYPQGEAQVKSFLRNVDRFPERVLAAADKVEPRFRYGDSMSCCTETGVLDSDHRDPKIPEFWIGGFLFKLSSVNYCSIPSRGSGSYGV